MYAGSTFRKKTINFSQQLKMAKRRHAFFSTLVQEKEESVKFALTFSFRKVIRSFAIKKGRNCRKFNFFSPKIIGTD